MSIVLYYKTLYNYTKRYNIPWWIWGILALSIAASLWTLPVTLYHFGETSVWTVFANIAIAWAVWWILFFSVWYMLLWFLWNIFLYIFLENISLYKCLYIYISTAWHAFADAIMQIIYLHESIVNRLLSIYK
jgi:hypothetical protein